MQHKSSYSNVTEDMKKVWKIGLHLTQSPSQNPVTGKKPNMKQHFSEGETELSCVQAEKPQREVEFLHMKTLIWSSRTHQAHKTRVVTSSYSN